MPEEKKLQRRVRDEKGVALATKHREEKEEGVEKIAFPEYRIIRKRFQFEDEKSFAGSNKCTAAKENPTANDTHQRNRKRIGATRRDATSMPPAPRYRSDRTRRVRCLRFSYAPRLNFLQIRKSYVTREKRRVETSENIMANLSKSTAAIPVFKV